MHQGTLPLVRPPRDLADYSPRRWPAHLLEAEPAAPTSRRQWMLAVGGLFLGASASAALAAVVGAPGAAASAPSAGPALDESPAGEMPRRGTLAWGIRMADRPAGELIGASGDLRRLLPFVQQVVPERAYQLAPTYERLLEVALADSQGPREEIDLAGMLAVEALAELERGDIVTARARQIARRSDLELTGKAAARVRASGGK